jgi:type IV pilus assembly protein PilA
MLARLRKRIDEKEEGFTLIELLVVIIIIGILAAIAIPVFLSQKSKGYEASLKSDLRAVAENIESQNVDTQDYTAVSFGATTSVLLATSGTTISGQGAKVGTDSVNLSAGNSVTNVKTTASAFCLSATSSKASPAVTIYYSSTRGGLLPKGTGAANTCDASNM